MGKHKHDNKEILNRLRRVNGHLEKVITMLQQDEECLNVAQQLQAVSSAVSSAKKSYIQDHIETCLSDVRDPRSMNAKVKEFKEIAKYL